MSPCQASTGLTDTAAAATDGIGWLLLGTNGDYIAHQYIGHNYIGHIYVGHNYIGHNYVGQ